jgi:diacylglycerol kinase family enzyme
MGTGNLLARNLGVPMGPDEALAVALGGVRQPIDAGWVNGKLFVVMAGLGLDAQMLSGTSEPLKKRLGWFAYVISAVRQLGDPPMRVSFSADGDRRRRMRASALIVGNVGWLRGGLPLLPAYGRSAARRPAAADAARAGLDTRAVSGPPAAAPPGSTAP